LLAAIDDVPAPWYRQWWRPMVVMAAAVLAVAGVAIWEHSREPKPLTVAKSGIAAFPSARRHRERRADFAPTARSEARRAGP